MNQLVLTNEEDADYHAFKTMIATHDAFFYQKSCYALFMLFGNHLRGIYITCCLQRNLPKEQLLN
jgi:hypothetical protein